MTTSPTVPQGLTIEGCIERQTRLRQRLDRAGLDAIVLSNRRHVHYATGYWTRELFSPLALVQRDGPTILVVPDPPERHVASDEILIYPANELCTLFEHQDTQAFNALSDHLGGLRRLGYDNPIRPHLVQQSELVDMRDSVLAVRRTKSDDEIEWLRHVIAATEASLRHAADVLQPGLMETDLYAGMQAAATAYAGEMIGEFGNDFQIGGSGGAPRRRAAEPGEVAILDVTVDLRGYCSDMCRSFVVESPPTELHEKVYARLMRVFEHVEGTVTPGVRCVTLYQECKKILSGLTGLSFPHHLGHGIGLSPHEAPRLNPHWNDTFQAGDVFTVEPGLYGDELRTGIRIEENYVVTESGVEKLTSFPTSLAQ